MSAIRRRRRGRRNGAPRRVPGHHKTGVGGPPWDKIYVPYQEAESEFVEKRSRFIGHIWPVDSEDQAQELIRRVKKQHYDARHNCWCYLLGNVTWCVVTGTWVSLTTEGPRNDGDGTGGGGLATMGWRENVTV